jgi:hypothetical protein
MLTEAKYMAETRDRVGLGRKRSLFGPFFIAEDDLIDLIEREAGDLDRRVSEDQFLEFDFKFAKIPLAFFAQPIKGKAQRPLFHIRQVINPDAGHGGKTQGLCRLDPDFPIKDKIVLADKDGSTEPQFADRAHEFPHMSRSALADFTRRQLQIVKSNAYEFELGQSVVPRYVRCRRCLRELQELFAPMAAFPLQLTLNSVLVDEEIMTMPGHSSISC